MMKSAEVIIVGAGAAGLYCAKTLTKAGVKVLVLEARERIGGRAFTLKSDFFQQPLELGPEFIHGNPKILSDLLTQQREAFTDVLDCRFVRRGRRLQKDEDFWEDLEKILKKLNPNRKNDRSISDFLKNQNQNFSAKNRNIFETYVEGFQAADLNKIGEIALAQAEKGDEGELSGGAALFRPAKGFSNILQKLVADAKLENKIRLGCLVRYIDWKENSVTLKTLEQGRHQTYRSKKVVITTPISLLKEQDSLAGIHIHPKIPALTAALEQIHMGHVQRINFEFSTRFWEDLSKDKIGFLHAGPDFYFPTWWTQMPLRSPVLVAWQGGPKAEELGTMPLGKRLELALKTLSYLTQKTPAFLKSHFVSYYTHNWSEDPYSLGAYSYNGLKNRHHPKLQHGFANTIWISGEAIAQGADQGTVHGAMKAGERTAKQILNL